MFSHNDSCTGASTQPAQDQHYVPHLHWQNDMGHPGPIEQFVQPHGFADSHSSGSLQPMHSPSLQSDAQAIPVAHHYVPHVHWQSVVSDSGNHMPVESHACHVPFGGSQPMLPANSGQHDHVGSQPMHASGCQPMFAANCAQHDAGSQPMLPVSDCHVPFGGSQPMLPANFAQYDIGTGCHEHVVGSQPMLHGNACHVQLGGGQPMLPAIAQHDHVGSQPMFANTAQHDAQPYGSNLPAGGSQPMFPAIFAHNDVGSQPMQFESQADHHGSHVPVGWSQLFLPANSAHCGDQPQVGSQPTMQLASHAQPQGQMQFGSQPLLPSSHGQPDVEMHFGSQPMHVATTAQPDAQPHGCNLPSRGSQPFFPANHAQPELQLHSGGQPMLMHILMFICTLEVSPSSLPPLHSLMPSPMVAICQPQWFLPTMHSPMDVLPKLVCQQRASMCHICIGKVTLATIVLLSLLSSPMEVVLLATLMQAVGLAN